MINRTIHYCWFGGAPLPNSAIKCIGSWKKYFPGWEIKEWNENNFDVFGIPYTAQAYQAGKYAFVSDYARFKILYEEGGIYFDTDVEVIKSFDDIISEGPFLGFEIDPKGKRKGAVNPGLGMGAEPGMEFYIRFLKAYRQHPGFINPDGSYNTKDAVVNITTKLLKEVGIQEIEGMQTVAGINIYPSEWFNPYDYATGNLEITPETHSIHWFSKSWQPSSLFRDFCSHLYHRIVGIRSK